MHVGSLMHKRYSVAIVLCVTLWFTGLRIAEYLKHAFHIYVNHSSAFCGVEYSTVRYDTVRYSTALELNRIEK